jgi:hypothetical protein
MSKRVRLAPATEVDRNAMDVVNVATQTAHSLINMQLIDETRQQFRDGALSFTNRPTNENDDYQPRANKPVFRDLSDRSQTLMVEQIINGKDIALFREYQNDPEMARWALRRRIQPIGYAAQNSEWNKEDPDLGIIKAGLQTCESVGAMPGERAVFEVPPLGNLDPRTGSVADGTDCNVQTLYLRPYNKNLVAETFVRVLGHLVHDPAQWAAAMRGYSTGANVWMNAAKNFADAYLFAGLMMVFTLVEGGKLQVVGGVRELAGLTPGRQSTELIERLAQFFQLTPDRGAISTLTTADFQGYKKMKVEFARRATYVPTPSGKINLVDEFGFAFDPASRQYKSTARTDDLLELRRGTPAADIVNVQVNATKMAAAAFVEAANEEERNVAGTFLSPSSEKGARKAIVSLGVAS